MNQNKKLSKDNASLEDIVIPPEKLVFIPLGGATGVGMNFFLYGYKGKWLVVDCGIGFPGDGLPGVDLLLPNPSFISKHKKDIVGLVITHAHEDHIGGVAYLWQDLQCRLCDPVCQCIVGREIIRSRPFRARRGACGGARFHY